MAEERERTEKGRAREMYMCMYMYVQYIPYIPNIQVLYVYTYTHHTAKQNQKKNQKKGTILRLSFLSFFLYFILMYEAKRWKSEIDFYIGIWVLRNLEIDKKRKSGRGEGGGKEKYMFCDLNG